MFKNWGGHGAVVCRPALPRVHHWSRHEIQIVVVDKIRGSTSTKPKEEEKQKDVRENETQKGTKIIPTKQATSNKNHRRGPFFFKRKNRRRISCLESG